MKYLVVGLLLMAMAVSAADLTAIRNVEPYREFSDMTYRELKENDARGRAVFTVDNRINELTDSRVYINFIEDCGYVKSYKIFVPEVCQKLVSRVPIYTRGLGICERTRNGTICTTPEILSGYNDTYEESICWQQVRSISIGMSDYKIEADIQPATCKDGSYGHKVDWVPVIETDAGQIITKREWAWWNATYTYKLPINCSNLDDGVPFSINGSSVSFDGEPHTIWTACSGPNTSLYYNTASDWMVANDTHKLPWERESGQGKSNQHASLWTGYSFVSHLNTTGTASNDSSSNAFTGTIGNSPQKIEGVFGGAIRFDGSAPNEYIEHGDTDMFGGYGTLLWFGNLTSQVSISPYLFSQYSGGGWYIQLTSTSYAGTMRLYTKGSPTLSVFSDEIYQPKWELYTIVKNSTYAKMYFNLTDVTGWDASSTVANSVNFLVNTRTPGTYETPSIADVDEVRYYNGALGLSYLTQVYNNWKNVGGYGNTLTLESLIPPPTPVNQTTARSYSWIY